MSSSMENSGVLLTRVEDLLNWGRKNSTWYPCRQYGPPLFAQEPIEMTYLGSGICR